MAHHLEKNSGMGSVQFRQVSINSLIEKRSDNNIDNYEVEFGFDYDSQINFDRFCRANGIEFYLWDGEVNDAKGCWKMGHIGHWPHHRVVWPGDALTVKELMEIKEMNSNGNNR